MSPAASSAAVGGRKRELASSVTSRRTTSGAGPELTIVVPTLNERDNVGPLIDRLDRLLEGVDWEAVFVDDDSADDTAAHLRGLGRTDRRIRCIRRLGRRGLSSACIEGILATSARYIAVIDANLQHDETLLPRMLAAVSALSSTSWAAASLIVMTRMSFFAGARRSCSRCAPQLCP